MCLTSRPSLPECPRCREALVAGRPSLPVVAGKPSLLGGARCREALVAGRPFSGGHILEKGPPRDRPGRCSKSFILWQNLTWQNPVSISRIQVCLTSRPSLPGGPRCRSLPGSPRCREALVAGGPRCREALVAGRPSLPGGPRCREALVAGTTKTTFQDVTPTEKHMARCGPPRNFTSRLGSRP